MAEPQLPCLDDDTVVAFLEQRLPAGQVAQIEVHVDGCASCRRLLSEMARMVGPGSSPSIVQGPVTELDPSRQTRTFQRAEAEDPVSNLPRGAAVGRYIIVDRIGEGGMGVVYSAYDPELDRKVALKLLRANVPGLQSSESRQRRLRREAQAMARLSHPNVVSVYDLGSYGDRVFVTMELVEGVTLARWLQERPRSWREILQVFRRAGRGLAAAHAAGLVHRDFKPDNVLVTRGDHPRVTDFGLARATALDTESQSQPVPIHVTQPLAPPLSRTDAVEGTPAFMSPEQHQGFSVDTRTDQFSFCVALYQALYGERPFPGDSSDALLAAELKGEVRPEPLAAAVPAWVRRAVLRGLAAAPEQRYPSMDALVATLSHDPRRRLRLFAMAVLIVLVVAEAGLAVAQFRNRSAQLCTGAERRLAGVWDDARQKEIEQAFIASGALYARDAWLLARRVLDAYARAWVSMHTEACEATRIRGEQTEQLLTLRMVCLDRRLEQLKATTELLAHADADLVARSGKSIYALPGLEGCTSSEALLSEVPPPDDAATGAQVKALRARLAQVFALRDAGKYSQGLKQAEAIAAEALATSYPPIEAEALSVLGELQWRSGRAAEAQKTLRQAFRAAIVGRHDRMAAMALLGQIYALALQDRFDDGHEVASQASAFIERLGKTPELEGSLEHQLGTLSLKEGKLAEAAWHFQRALVVREKQHGPNHPSVASLLNNLGIVLRQQGRYEEAHGYYGRAVATWEAVVGPEHPEVAASLGNLANVYSEQGRYQDALAAVERATAINEKTLGPKHPENATHLTNLANTYIHLGRYQEAVPLFQRALAVQQSSGSDRDTALVLHNLGEAYDRLGRYGRARETFRRARELWEKALGPAHPDVANSIESLGNLALREGKLAEARSLHQRALAIRKKALGVDHPELAYSLLALGDVEEAAGSFAAAMAYYEQVLKIREKVLGAEHPDVAFVRLRMGQLQANRGELDKGLATCRAALTIAQRALGPEHPFLADYYRAEAKILLAKRQYADAIARHERALALLVKAVGATHPDRALDLAGIGQAKLGLGAPKEAVKPLEEALAVQAEPTTQLALARALWDGGGDRDRARKLATLARAAFARGPASQKKDLYTADTWLARHKRSQ